MNKSIFRKKSVSKLLEDLASGYGDSEHHGGKLNKVLRTKDLTFMGIAAVIGAGIFSTIGVA
ncbi:MAG: amino acid transporter, partial [Sphingobacteriaceae bacterium]